MLRIVCEYCLLSMDIVCGYCLFVNVCEYCHNIYSLVEEDEYVSDNEIVCEVHCCGMVFFCRERLWDTIVDGIIW